MRPRYALRKTRWRVGAYSHIRRLLGTGERLSVLSVAVDTRSRRSGRMPDGWRMASEAKARGNARDMLTEARRFGR
jgi:hypothetical protein